MSRLKELYRAGQSPWYDNIERRLFKSGEFARLINEYGIVGVTSNPTIFDKAISGSSDYDEQIKKISNSVMQGPGGGGVYQIYDELTIQDVAAAADMLMDIFKKTDGVDGYVSLEVLPEYAYDAEKTIECAKRLFKRLNRKNIMIKVPGTKEGLAAITELISEGINVNATLLFSLAHYEGVAKAYIDGLRARLKKGEDIRAVTSVASVFISRIDTSVDKVLEEMASKEPGKKDLLGLRGRAAVANSKIIYGRFRELFRGKEFGELEKKGANIQRPLWASTSAKNPAYRDVKYIEELIGPDTINTIPHQTVMAFCDHGIVKPAVAGDLTGAGDVIARLKSSGIDVDAICEKLQRDGVKVFSDSFNSLIASIEKKMSALR